MVSLLKTKKIDVTKKDAFEKTFTDYVKDNKILHRYLFNEAQKSKLSTIINDISFGNYQAN